MRRWALHALLVPGPRSPAPSLTTHRPPRATFLFLLHSFTTYRSLLLRIKQEYDVALDDGLSSLYDNVHMKAELAVVDERMVRRWLPRIALCRIVARSNHS